MSDRSVYVEDANGTMYLAEPAGCFDVPGQAMVAYEDEVVPAGSRMLFTLTLVDDKPKSCAAELAVNTEKRRPGEVAIGVIGDHRPGFAWVTAMADPMMHTGFRVMARRCNECLLGPNKIVSDERRDEVLTETHSSGSFFVCHKATLAGVEGGCCKAFYDQSEEGIVAFVKRTGIPIQWLDADALDGEVASHDEQDQDEQNDHGDGVPGGSHVE